jgi:hypothetical protein
MYFLDMPNPVLWGAMAFAFNYFPYLGRGSQSRGPDRRGRAELRPVAARARRAAVFFTFTVIEGQFCRRSSSAGT